VERDAYQTLLDWKCSPRRKPLLLRGARQVGKTWLLKRFGEREYSEIVYLNFEEDPRGSSLDLFHPTR
jgi:predicted AAA+ superfamily ATPase